jgi:hypothetical protein
MGAVSKNSTLKPNAIVALAYFSFLVGIRTQTKAPRGANKATDRNVKLGL